jgi:hypothetical protein
MNPSREDVGCTDRIRLYCEKNSFFKRCFSFFDSRMRVRLVIIASWKGEKKIAGGKAQEKTIQHKFFIENRNLDELIPDILLALKARDRRAQGGGCGAAGTLGQMGNRIKHS